MEGTTNIYVTVWGIEHNKILQLYTLLFNNPLLRLNNCNTTIIVHYIRLQHRASPEPQSPEPGLSPGISNPPNQGLRQLSGFPRRALPGTAELSRTGISPGVLKVFQTIRAPEPGFARN